MRILHTGEAHFEAEFRRIRNRGKMLEGPKKIVSKILGDVAEEGDKALFRYTRKFDGVALNSDSVEVTSQEIREASTQVAREDFHVLKAAAMRIEQFHRKQIVKGKRYSEEAGISLGWLVRPLDRIGIYAPGGLAAYPSTVLMAAIPARVAGVNEIILVSPAKKGSLNPLVLAAASLSGVNRIFKIGGAQAVAALAYGTESIPAVDKIVGPGNAFVTEAKRMVFGTVGIDMIAGPSEILVIADSKADPRRAAADLLSQAEHDSLASAILLTPSETLAEKVRVELKLQLDNLSRKPIAAASIRDFGAIIITRSLIEAVDIANRFAPEHLEIMIAEPEILLSKINHAGAVFLGAYTPEAIGDYLAGPSHILPTAGTARFSSPLGVYDFVKRSSIISFSSEAFEKYGPQAARFAELEGLHAHGNSIAVRQSRKQLKKP